MFLMRKLSANNMKSTNSTETKTNEALSDDEFLPELKEEEPTWEERKTCFTSLDPQCGEIWARLRRGAIQASKIAAICKRAPYCEDTPEEIALDAIGLSAKSFSVNSMKRDKSLQEEGIKGEPIVRDWLSEQLEEPIRQIGVSVWKEDPRFRGSLDGELKNKEGEFIEIKIPREMYRPLIEATENRKKGHINEHPSSYIFNSHYDQMIANGVITGKKFCYYTVACLRTGDAFVQRIPIDEEHFHKVLYPQATKFHDTYIAPLMKKYNIKMIMPPGMECPNLE